MTEQEKHEYEMAAKAAGYEINCSEYSQPAIRRPSSSYWIIWQPKTMRVDSFMLMVDVARNTKTNYLVSCELTEEVQMMAIFDWAVSQGQHIKATRDRQ